MFKKIDKWKVFYALVFVTGLILMVLGIRIYRVTVISNLIPISIILSVGTVTYMAGKKHYHKHNKGYGIFFGLLQNTCSWGFISCYLFMASNYYLADNEDRNLKFEIKSKSSMSGSKRRRNERKPLVTIDYFGFEKELVFRYTDTKKVENADEVSVSVDKGFFGFDVLDHYETVDKTEW
jgi:hypothetical protein